MSTVLTPSVRRGASGVQVEDVVGGSAEQLGEEKDHYLRVVTRGGAVSIVDFRGNVEEAQTCGRRP